MRAIDWLPAEPLSVTDCLAYRRDFEPITMFAPILGVRPTPTQRVVMVYVGLGSTVLYTAFDPDRTAWVPIERGPASELIPRTAEVGSKAVSFVESRYPDATIDLLKQAFAT